MQKSKQEKMLKPTEHGLFEEDSKQIKNGKDRIRKLWRLHKPQMVPEINKLHTIAKCQKKDYQNRFFS